MKIYKPYLIEENYQNEEHILFISQIKNHRGEEILENI